MKHKKQLRKVNDDTTIVGIEKPADNTANKSLSTGIFYIQQYAYSIVRVYEKTE